MFLKTIVSVFKVKPVKV